MPKVRSLVLGLVTTLVVAAPASAAPGDVLDTYIGTLDTEFSPYGDVITDIDSKGRVVVAFSHDTDGGSHSAGMRLAVMRLTSTFDPDPTFNGGVPLDVDFLTDPDNVYAIGVEAGPGDSIYAGGSVAFDRIALVHLAESGAYDNAFSGDGRHVQLLPTSSSNEPHDFQLDSAGRPVVVGSGQYLGGRKAFFARFTTAGVLDTGFSGDGNAEFAVPNNSGQLFAVEPLPDGGLVASGTDAFVDAIVLKVLGTGAPDTGFDGDGLVISKLGAAPGDNAQGFGIGRDSSGRVLLTGGAAVGGNGNYVVARFTPAGAPDATFGTGTPATGVVWLPPGAGRGWDIAETCDGRILTGGSGSRSVGGGPDQNSLLLARLTPTGALDTTFAPGSPVPGMALTTFEERADGYRFEIDGGTVVQGGFRRAAGADDKPVILRYANAPCGGAVTPPDDEDDDDPVDPVVTPPAKDPAPGPPPPAALAPPGVLPPPARVVSPPPPSIAQAVTFPSTRRCASRRRFSIRLKVPAGAAVTSAEVLVNGKRAAVRRGARLRSKVDLRSLPRGRFTVTIRLRLADGRTVSGQRRYRTCAPKRRGAGRPRV